MQLKTSIRHGLITAALFLLTASAAHAQVTFSGLLDGLTDREALAIYPDGQWTTGQASSYNRLSKAPTQANWYMNPDRSNFIRSEVNEGRTEGVMMEDTGPGVLTRWWMFPRNLGNVRVYFDGATTPAITIKPEDLLGGTGPFAAPLSGTYSSGKNLYAPIPYSQGMKVTYDGTLSTDSSVAIWYNLEYRKYTAGTPVTTYSNSDPTNNQAKLTTVGQQLLNPATVSRGTGNQTAQQTQALAAGQTLEKKVSGTGSIRRLKLNVNASDVNQALQDTYVEISFDGERTVNVPAGQFFGTGRAINPYQTYTRTVEANGDMTSYFVMPYEKNADIKIVNKGGQAVNVNLEVETGGWTWDANSMHFHSDYRRQGDVRFPQDWNYTRIRGKGVYVGDTLTVKNSYAKWWGEGDEKIYVDGENFPSHYGTGSEDYYGYAACDPTPFSHPYMAQPTGAGNLAVGTSVNTRTRALDAIPFTNAFKLDMEHYENSTTYREECDYAVATYWYGTAGTTSHVRTLANLAANYRAGAAGQTSSQVGIADTAGDGQWLYYSANYFDLSIPLTLRQQLTYGSVGNAGHSGFGGGQDTYNLGAISNQTIFTTGESLRDGELAIIPSNNAAGAKPYTVARWIAGASSAGDINIYGSIRDTVASGDSINFYILVDGQVVWKLLGWYSMVEEAYFDLDLNISEGSIVDFVVGNRGGAYLGDESILNVNIGRFEVDTVVPEPATCLLLGMGSLLALRRRRPRTPA